MFLHGPATCSCILGLGRHTQVFPFSIQSFSCNVVMLSTPFNNNMYKSKTDRSESVFRLLSQQLSERMMILRRDVCTRRYLMSAEHEFSIRCEGQISGSGPGVEPSLRRTRGSLCSRRIALHAETGYVATVPQYREQCRTRSRSNRNIAAHKMPKNGI